MTLPFSNTVMTEEFISSFDGALLALEEAEQWIQAKGHKTGTLMTRKKRNKGPKKPDKPTRETGRKPTGESTLTRAEVEAALPIFTYSVSGMPESMKKVWAF